MREEVLKVWNSLKEKINEFKLSEEDKYALRIIENFNLAKFSFAEFDQIQTREAWESYRKDWKKTAEDICVSFIKFENDNYLMRTCVFYVSAYASTFLKWMSLSDACKHIREQRNKLEDQLEQLSDLIKAKNWGQLEHLLLQGKIG